MPTMTPPKPTSPNPRLRNYSLSGLPDDTKQKARILAATRATTIYDVVRQAIDYAAAHPDIIKGGTL